ncbi:MAG: gliding motility-associated C-terminal domain-containing protein [Lewinella sp.]|nr:gliding motility-associated C-terminal domain-containing protein [Lewinella sp.]
MTGLGCDSVVNLTLVELQNATTNLQETRCFGETFSVGDSTYTQSGQYTQTFAAANGCDSIVNLDLTIRNEILTDLPATICAGQTYTVGSSNFDTTGTYTVVLTAANGCDSTVNLDLTVLPLSHTDLTVAVCNGQTYTVGSQTFNASGNYNVTLMAANGCDSTIALNLTVRPKIQSNRNATICSGSSFTLGGQTFTDAGSYQVQFMSVTGCDSTVNLTLTVEDVLIESAIVELCEGESYPVGDSTYTVSGQYQNSFITPQGCDSLFMLDLTVHPTKYTDLSPSICNGETFAMGGTDYAATGVYQTTLQQAGTGCDSVVTLNLTVLATPETFLAPSICDGDSFTVGASVYQTAGSYVDVLTAANGCDSTVYLDLTILDVPETFLTPTICDGEVYTVGTTDYTTTGSFTEILTAANGCDSIVHLDLTVLPNASSTVNALICQGETYTLNGTPYNATGQYATVLPAANGCDSTVTLNLTVAPVKQNNIVASICQNGSYTVGSSVYTQTGIYRDTLSTSFGCDSIIVLDLTVTDFYQTNLNISLCEGESYTVGTSTYEQTGMYVDQFTSQDGCDSFVNLNLTILPIPVTDLAPAICDGETYTVGSSVYTVSGIYQDVLTAASGCDSIVNLDLTVIPIPEVFLTPAICDGETYSVGTSDYTVEGTYTDVLTAASGCDSIVHLDLTVFPIPETNLDITICDGETYSVGTSQYTASGNYADVLTAFTGCDSIVNLALTVLAIPETFLTEAICQGDQFQVGGSVYTDAGQYQDVLVAASGCDSIVHLDLTVNPVFDVVLNEDICDTDSFTVGTSSFSTPGSYSVVLSTVNGCDSVITLNLSNHPCQLQWTSAAEATSCAGGADGVLEFSMTIGTPPYQYTLETQAGTTITSGTLDLNGSPISFNNLAPGNYKVSVVDSYGITADFTETVTQPAQLTAQITHVSQFGQYHISCPEESDGALGATVQGGTPPYAYAWSNGSASAGPQGLTAGDYTVTITDQKGCQVTASSTLLAPPPIEASLTSVDPACFGDKVGQIQVVDVTGGVTPYVYAINSRPFSSAPLFANLDVGVYNVKVQDAAGCEWSQEITINQPEELVVDLGPDVTISLGDELELNAQTSYEVNLFKWSSTVPVVCFGDTLDSNCPDPIVAPMETSVFAVSVADDKGCTASDKITVYVSKDRPVYIPNAFSPDGDGVNDVFMIQAKGSVVTNVKSFLIFNRWGESMFELYNFQPNDPVYGWDGTHRGRLLNAGVYVFFAEVEFIDGETVLYKGDVTLMR